MLAKIAEMPEPDRAMAERLHAIVKASAPALSPKTWYGMPAYAKDGKVVCFFQSAQKFKSRYATFGFNDKANLDEGAMWPTSFALKELTAAEEARIARAREESGELSPAPQPAPCLVTYDRAAALVDMAEGRLTLGRMVLPDAEAYPKEFREGAMRSRGRVSDRCARSRRMGSRSRSASVAAGAVGPS